MGVGLRAGPDEASAPGVCGAEEGGREAKMLLSGEASQTHVRLFDIGHRSAVTQWARTRRLHMHQLCWEAEGRGPDGAGGGSGGPTAGERGDAGENQN